MKGEGEKGEMLRGECGKVRGRCGKAWKDQKKIFTVTYVHFLPNIKGRPQKILSSSD